ncbi:CRISPR-associated endonuclease Cas2 [Candidatus Roizmanbacteria bacterium RIFCSPHIGHO2_01_FULL_39_8]|uniref:CRISPR-associated endonuclease Cas2 n=2 Tax=Candidatus Roizmaniibacteriota TaxID=1752723 RepID=A0A1F7GQR9_9BACT|nr:MAG: CRISPR-associated endonuclease Cas2 [Candidatus Roizmanbacteria bacterium RIFCSPHIGHO2_01_FULL_39_8]OGK25464.1 MAG: CRISPR-associated endonuclease Cas2 [Candidatus Roizmanbacteria bacterium RIFCSPHIGHO2_02_FULL_39_9]
MIEKSKIKPKRSDREETKNKEVAFKQWEIKDLLFAALGISVVLGGSILLTPNFPIVLGSIIKLIQEIKGEKVPNAKIKRTIQALEKKEIIYIEERDGTAYVHLKAWNQQILQYSLKGILDFKKRKKKWDGKWFMVLFDVPEIQRNKRDYLRRLLRKIGFYQYQKSVYLFPYECEDEIKLIKKIVESAKYMKYIIADRIEDEKQAKIFFQLS